MQAIEMGSLGIAGFSILEPARHSLHARALRSVVSDTWMGLFSVKPVNKRWKPSPVFKWHERFRPLIWCVVESPFCSEV